jgi:citrate synthase
MEVAMSKSVELIYQGKSYTLPIIEGTCGEQAVDISSLRTTTGLITYDPGFVSTGSCQSDITFLDGEKGILLYRGIPIEQLAEHSNFIETSFLLIHGHLPSQNELDYFKYHPRIH